MISPLNTVQLFELISNYKSHNFLHFIHIILIYNLYWNINKVWTVIFEKRLLYKVYHSLYSKQIVSYWTCSLVHLGWIPLISHLKTVEERNKLDHFSMHIPLKVINIGVGGEGKSTVFRKMNLSTVVLVHALQQIKNCIWSCTSFSPSLNIAFKKSHLYI